jgi:hypothetical protein
MSYKTLKNKLLYYLKIITLKDLRNLYSTIINYYRERQIKIKLRKALNKVIIVYRTYILT